MGGNTFYSNAEAYAFEILQQKLVKEAQRSAHQSMMEYYALKSLFNQGQFLYCIPFGGLNFQNPNLQLPICSPCSALCSAEASCNNNNGTLCLPSQPASTPHSAPSSHKNNGHCLPSSSRNHGNNNSGNNQQSIVHVNVKNGQPKAASCKPGSDECNLGKDGIEVIIDLRCYLPAEIILNVEEKSVEIKASHNDPQGSKTFARRYDLPACIILDSVKCVLSHDGYLMFSAAWVKME